MKHILTNDRVLTGLAAAGLATYAFKKAQNRNTKIISGVASALLGTHAATGYWPGDTATRMLTGSADHNGIDRMGQRVEASTTIEAPIEMVFEFWQNVENFPQFMSHLRSVTKTGDRTSHWVSDAPLGTSVEWDAETIKNVPNDVIAWQSTSGNVPNAGSVRFKRVGPHTRVRVKLGYTPPAGQIGASVAQFFGEDPKTQLNEYLAKLKKILEQGARPGQLA